MKHAYQEDRRSVSKHDVDTTLRSIAKRGADPVLESRYKKAVTSSQPREIVLKSLAKSQDEHGEIWTTNAYKLAIDSGVDNASQYVGHLVMEAYGAEIENIRERYYRFKDSLFAAYVIARPYMFSRQGGENGVTP